MPVMLTCICNPGTWQVKVEKLRVQGHPELYSEVLWKGLRGRKKRLGWKMTSVPMKKGGR